MSEDTDDGSFGISVKLLQLKNSLIIPSGSVGRVLRPLLCTSTSRRLLGKAGRVRRKLDDTMSFSNVIGSSGNSVNPQEDP